MSSAGIDELKLSLVVPHAATLGVMGFEKTYRLRDKIGGGADGSVYSAEVCVGADRGHWHALKIFSVDAHNPEREIAILQRLQPHPNIVPFHGVMDSDKHGPRRAIAFPQMDVDLRCFLAKRRSGLHTPLATSLCHQILRGLAYMHDQRIVHRDVKPANLLLWVDHDSMAMKLFLADFSRARELPVVPKRRIKGKKCVDSHMLPVSALAPMTPDVSTPQYCAPEAAFGPFTGECWSGPSADVWSFGLVAWEMQQGCPFMYGLSGAKQWAAAVCRIGPPEHSLNLGPRQGDFLVSALRHSSSIESDFPSTQSLAGTMVGYMHFIELSCVWNPACRASAQTILQYVPAIALAATQGGMDAPPPPPPPPPPPAEGARALMSSKSLYQTHLSVSAAFAGTASPKTLTKPDVTCDCSGHCNQKGHRYWGGVQCHRDRRGRTALHGLQMQRVGVYGAQTQERLLHGAQAGVGWVVRGIAVHAGQPSSLASAHALRRVGLCGVVAAHRP